MKLGPFPTGAPWGSAAIQAWLDRLRQIYNNALDGHIGVGGTDEHPVFTTTVAGFVPAPGSSSGEFLQDDGSWASVFTGLPLGTASPIPQEVIVKQSGVWVRLTWADFLTAINSVGSASLDFSQASNSQYIGAVHI